MDVPCVSVPVDCDDGVPLPVLVTDPVSPLLNVNCDVTDGNEPVVSPDDVPSEVSLLDDGVELRPEVV